MPLTQAARLLGGKTSAILERSKALDRYYQSPNYCLHCVQIIHVKDKERPSLTRKKKFCGHSCANAFNNALSPKRKRIHQCLICGSPVLATRKYCSDGCRRAGRIPRLRINTSKLVVTWRQRAKLRAVAYKGGCCQVCGYNQCMRAMNFHHINPLVKDFTISAAIYSWDKIRTELDKCVLLCANCHAEVHDGLLNVSWLAETDLNRHPFD